MAKFNPKRPNACRYDLKPDLFDTWKEATEWARYYQRSRILTEGVLVELVQEFGAATIEGIKRSAGLGHWSLDALYSLLVGEINPERQLAAQNRMNEMPGRERARTANQTKTVGAFMDQLAIDPNKPAPIEKPKRKPLPAGWMLREGAIEWMKENHPEDIHLVDQFFSQGVLAGYDETIYILHDRISQ